MTEPLSTADDGERTIETHIEPIEFEELLFYMLDIKEPDIELYRNLLNKGGCSVNELSEILGNDRSNINRRLLKLREIELVSRRAQVLEQGGHQYVYFATPPAELQQQLQAAFDEWCADVRKTIDTFPANLPQENMNTSQLPQQDQTNSVPVRARASGEE